MKKSIILIGLIFLLGSIGNAQAQYSTHFDPMREEGLNYYAGSIEMIKLQDLIIGGNYSLTIEGNITHNFVPRHSNLEIQFSYGNIIYHHLSLGLYLEGVLVDQYEMPTIRVGDQVPGNSDDLITAYGGYIIVFVFLVAVIYTAKDFN